MSPSPPTRRPESVLEEERDFLLRSLRDLEAEHDVGDIDDTDYQALRDDYTVRAAAVLRELAGDDPSEAASATVEAEAVDDVSGDGEPAVDEGDGDDVDDGAADVRTRWRRRAVIGGAAVVFGCLAGWAVLHATSSRSSGGAATGDAVGAQKVTDLLNKAQQEASSGKAVDAIKDCQAVLAIDPGQPQALAEEGWLLAQTQEPNLENQGLGDLEQALTTDPEDTTAHLYRGVVLLDLGRKAEAVPDLQYYLAHDPSPQIKAQVEKQLAAAQTP